MVRNGVGEIWPVTRSRILIRPVRSTMKRRPKSSGGAVAKTGWVSPVATRTVETSAEAGAAASRHDRRRAPQPAALRSAARNRPLRPSRVSGGAHAESASQPGSSAAAPAR